MIKSPCSLNTDRLTRICRGDAVRRPVHAGFDKRAMHGIAPTKLEVSSIGRLAGMSKATANRRKRTAGGRDVRAARD